ncbi:MAG: hypothetical protein WCG93_10155 [Paludibacter sp.]
MNIPLPLIIVAIGIFISVIGFGFKVIIENTKAIENINVVLAKILTSNMYEEKEGTAQHDYINRRMAKHSDIIQEHEIRITKLEK